MRPIRRTAVDSTQKPIVDALRAAGWSVWIIGWPCDLLLWKQGRGFKLMEVKKPNRAGGKFKPDPRQEEQNEFVERTQTPRVTSAEQALEALS